MALRSPVLPAGRRRPRPCPAVVGGAGAASSHPVGGAAQPSAARRLLLAEAEAARRGGSAASPPRRAVSTGVGEGPRGAWGRWPPGSGASVLGGAAGTPRGGEKAGGGLPRGGLAFRPRPGLPAAPRRGGPLPGSICFLPPRRQGQSGGRSSRSGPTCLSVAPCGYEASYGDVVLEGPLSWCEGLGGLSLLAAGRWKKMLHVAEAGCGRDPAVISWEADPRVTLD